MTRMFAVASCVAASGASMNLATQTVAAVSAARQGAPDVAISLLNRAAVIYETYGELNAAVKDALANTGSPSIIEVVVANKSIPANARWKTN